MSQFELVSVAGGRLRLRWRRRSAGEAAQAAAGALEGVQRAELRPASRSLVVYFDPARLPADAVVAALDRAATHVPAAPPSPNGRVAVAAPGPAQPIVSAHEHTHATESLRGPVTRLLLGGTVLAGLGLQRLFLGAVALPPPLTLVVGGVSVIVGLPFLRGMVRTLRGRQRLDTDTLVGVATGVSIVMGEGVVALVVLWLLTLGELLQALVLRRTRRAIRALLVDRGEAWVVVNGTEVRTPVDQLQPGDIVAVYKGDRLPADGVVVEGEGAVNEAPITGESIPVFKQADATVWAGTLVESGALRLRVERVGTETAVGRLIARVEQAEELRAPIQTLGEAFARRFVPVSFALAASVFLLTGDARRAMTMLLVACPCAAGLSTPTAVSAAIANAARRGILIKGGTHLEAAGQIDTVVFDKTGTLTLGQPRVSTVYGLADDIPPEEVLALAASGEFHSKHPLALAVVRHAEERALEIPPHEECEIIVGQGVHADLQGNCILVGSARLLEQFQVPVPGEAQTLARRLAAEGETPLYVGYRDRVVGVLGIADQVRPEAPEALRLLRELGVRRILMLTGDDPVVAAAVGRQLGIPESDIRARALPEDKYALVRELQAAGHRVAMVGDGINDAPALALADVGIAMGTAGSDVAIETADVALASNDVRQVASVIRLGRRTLAVIRQNYALSIGVNSLGIVAGALGTLNPFVAAVLHNASSLAVVLNSARLTRYRDLEGLAPAPAPQPQLTGAPVPTS
ncbi:MAG: cation-translocating P-type ATPase [Chloroflexi bacterium]|nr:cation-translocating P-type ATPase [Chloroflexota bacterium]